MRARDQPILARSLRSVEARATHISSSSSSSTQPSPAYGASASRCLSVSWPHLVVAARAVAARGRRRTDGEGERKDEASPLAGGRSRTATLMATAEEDGECREPRAGGAFPLRVSVLAGGVLEERGGRRRADDSAASHRIAVVRQASAERGGNPSFRAGSRARGGRDERGHLLHRTRSRAYVTLARSGMYIPNSVLPSGEREEGVEELRSHQLERGMCNPASALPSQAAGARREEGGGNEWQGISGCRSTAEGLRPEPVARNGESRGWKRIKDVSPRWMSRTQVDAEEAARAQQTSPPGHRCMLHQPPARIDFVLYARAGFARH